MCKWLLDRGAKINFVDANGITWATALQTASWQGYLDVVKLLVSHGANVNALGPGTTPLDYALSYDKDDVIAYLRSVGAKESFNLVPRDNPAAHTVIKEFLTKKYGKVSAKPLASDTDDDVPIYTIPAGKKLDATTSFTLGMSDFTQVDSKQRQGFAELVLHLPTKWPAKETWPLDAMRAVCQLSRTNTNPLTDGPIIRDDLPMGKECAKMLWWFWWHPDDSDCCVAVPDKRAVYFYTMSLIHESEAKALREKGTEEFAKLWKKKKAGVILDPKRKSIVK
jgi:hypothetical protein